MCESGGVLKGFAAHTAMQSLLLADLNVDGKDNCKDLDFM